MTLSKSNPKPLVESFSCSLFQYLQVSEKRCDIERLLIEKKLNKDTAKYIVQFILLDEKDACTKQKILSVFRQKHQVVHDHYSFESLKTTGSSIMVQLSKIYPLENGGSRVLLAFWSLTSTMSIDRLLNASSTNIS